MASVCADPPCPSLGTVPPETPAQEPTMELSVAMGLTEPLRKRHFSNTQLSSLPALLPQLLHQGNLQICIQRCLFLFVDVDRHITHTFII